MSRIKTGVVLLNAPPNAGKDTIAAELSVRLGLPHHEFKAKLFELALCISGISKSELDYLYRRENKEVPTDLLFGLSPRQFMIAISEDMIKPVCGKHYFGEFLARTVRDTGGVISDSGFNQEAEILVDALGEDRVFCVRFSREGCSFEGDSRNYLTTPHIKHYLDTTNDGNVEDIVEEIISWLNGLCIG